MTKLFRFILILALLLSSGLLLPARAAPAALTATLTVTTAADTIANDGLCSLREAVIAANTDSAYNGCPAGAAADTIVFDPTLGSPLTLQLSKTGADENAAQSGDLDVFGTLTINGAGVTLDGLSADRLLHVFPSARLTLNGLVLTHGNPGIAAGGAVYVSTTGRLTLNASQVISNTAFAGGGVMSLGLLTATDSLFSGNQGGAINNNTGLLVLANLQVLDNTGDFAITNQHGGQMTFTGGVLSGNANGGLLNSLGAQATFTNVTISNNLGGGIYNTGVTTNPATRLTLNNTTVSGNSATSGAGLLNDGIGALATITDSTFSGNIASANGGAINNSGSLTLTRSALHHNQARAGGAINHLGASLTLTNVTLSQNSVTDNGGGLYNRSTASLNYVTLYGNTAGVPGTGGNLYNDGESTSISLHNTLLAAGGAAGNCGSNQAVLNSLGYNLEDADTCGLLGSGDQVSTDPLLGPLQDNGGLTFTHALGPASPAVNAGDPTGCSGTDQRAVARPQGATCDTGAYELILGASADLALFKVDAIDPVVVGAPITYTLTVTNLGPDAATGVTLTDTLPAGLILISTLPSQGVCGFLGQLITCSLGVIPNGLSASIELAALAAAAGDFTNTASVTSSLPDPSPENNTATAVTTVKTPPSANLLLTKVDAADPVFLGEPITYTLTVTNLGPDDAAGVSLTDNLPVGLSYVSGSPSQGSCAHDNQLITCDLGSLPNGLSATVELVAATLVTGNMINNAFVFSILPDPNFGNNIATTTTLVKVPEADLKLSKVAALSPVLVGEPITYTLTLTNLGPDPALGVVLTDTLPSAPGAWLDYVSHNPSQGSCQFASQVLTCSLGALNKDATATVQLVVTAPATGQKINSAAAASATADPVAANNTASVIVTVKDPPPPLRYLYLPLILKE